MGEESEAHFSSSTPCALKKTSLHAKDWSIPFAAFLRAATAAACHQTVSHIVAFCAANDLYGVSRFVLQHRLRPERPAAVYRRCSGWEYSLQSVWLSIVVFANLVFFYQGLIIVSLCRVSVWVED